ncbi:hypothetical protein Ct61P_06041 [Colletotrichum tofieldiae]|nr:hypothetical protein Ct61P_06041 [Colletotrichum tofieldiae]
MSIGIHFSPSATSLGGQKEYCLDVLSQDYQIFNHCTINLCTHGVESSDKPLEWFGVVRNAVIASISFVNLSSAYPDSLVGIFLGT